MAEKANFMSEVVVKVIDKLFTTAELKEHFLAKMKQDVSLH